MFNQHIEEIYSMFNQTSLECLSTVSDWFTICPSLTCQVDEQSIKEAWCVWRCEVLEDNPPIKLMSNLSWKPGVCGGVGF